MTMRLLGLLSLAGATLAYTVQDDWLFPPPPDGSANVTIGEVAQVRWKPSISGVFPQYCSDCDTTNVDLWLTSTNVYRKLTTGINIETTFHYNWTVDVSESDLESSEEWTFRFIPAGIDFIGSKGQEVSSSKFNIQPAPVTSTPTPTPTPTATTLPGTNSPTSETGDSGGGGLSTGAKGGIGAGVTVGALILIGLAFFFWRRLRSMPNNSPQGPPPPYPPSEAYQPDETQQIQQFQQAPGGYFAVPGQKPPTSPTRSASELPGSQTLSELEGGYNRQIRAELADTGRR